MHYTCFVHVPKTVDDIDKFVEDALQPFHEYESDGYLDQYVIPVDIKYDTLNDYLRTQIRLAHNRDTDEYELIDYIKKDRCLDNYEKEQILNQTYKLKDNEIQTYMRYNVPSSPSDIHNRHMVTYIPDPWEIVLAPIYYAVDFLKHCELNGIENVKFANETTGFDGSYVLLTGPLSNIMVTKDEPILSIERKILSNVKVFDLTNPNAKWDWWTESGRWEFSVEDIPEDTCSRMHIKNYNVNIQNYPFAFLTNGKWYSSDDMDDGEYKNEFRNFLQNADPEDILVLIDCHI